MGILKIHNSLRMRVLMGLKCAPQRVDLISMYGLYNTGEGYVNINISGHISPPTPPVVHPNTPTRLQNDIPGWAFKALCFGVGEDATL